MLTSPFIFDGPLPPEDVIGREDELATIRDRAAHGRFVLLHAPRRYGKTSLVNLLAHRARVDRDLALVTVDLEGVLTIDDIARRFEHAYRTLPRTGFARALRTALSALSVAGVMVSRGGVSLTPRSATEAAPLLEGLLALPYEAAGKVGTRVLVVLDEFQAIAPIANADAVLRSQIQHQHQRDRVSYLFSGSEQSLLQAIFADRARPLYGQAEQVALGPLSATVAAQMVAAKFAETDRDPGVALTSLVVTADGHPQRLGFLADALWQVTGEGEAADGSTWVAALEGALRRANAEFLAVEAGLAMTQRKVALLLALGEPPTGAAAARMGLSKGSARGALQALAGKGHAHDRDGTVVLVDPLYAAWLRNRFGPPTP
ncbi:MAG: AAA family ATPase [Acidimicrobiales bacterium]